MKTEMNPDLEFLRGLRERLRLREKMCVECCQKTSSFEIHHQMLGEQLACSETAAEITDYLKTRGIE